ncbi:hypothetical protein MGN01_34690 [Methylobacterium gnaphalii]|uniref:Uncharacterized protein n=1 Tax=Methylobacterium gnaphalii TaxID=1010610 RepID=A0A512JNU1_9HYPH|nr:hypothetical protein MGN01_34690 [Methylobacterium gnaphalii]GLS49113.1 hypothetical protein GCM10007885_19610 [Methylobacterium gnaphalii]
MPQSKTGPSAALIAQLAERLRPAGVLTAEDDIAPYAIDWRRLLPTHRAAQAGLGYGCLRIGSTEEVVGAGLGDLFEPVAGKDTHDRVLPALAGLGRAAGIVITCVMIRVIVSAKIVHPHLVPRRAAGATTRMPASPIVAVFGIRLPRR